MIGQNKFDLSKLPCYPNAVFISEIKIDGAKLKRARGTRKPSEVASEVGITRQYLWQIEAGRAVPSGSILARLCWLYGKPIEEFTTR